MEPSTDHPVDPGRRGLELSVEEIAELVVEDPRQVGRVLGEGVVAVRGPG